MTSNNEVHPFREDEPALREETAGHTQTEAALAVSEEQFRTLVTGVQDYAIFMLSVHGVVESWNTGAERIKGYRAEEIIGQHFSRFYTPEDVTTGRAEKALAITSREGKYEEEGWRLRKDGSRFWANVVITALRDDKGELRGFAKVTRDLTERRESERIKSILYNVIDGIITFDETGLIESINPAAEKIFGYSAEEVLGLNVGMLAARPNEIDWAAQSVSASTVQEVHGRRKGGGVFTMEIAIGAFHFQGRRAFTGVVRDITERKRLEEELQQRITELAFAAKRKDEFLAMLAHELRNPLAPIRNSLHVLKLKSGDWQTVDQVREIMTRQVGHLGRLVDDLLDVSRITRGKVTLKLERLDVARLVRQCASDHQNTFNAAQVTLTVELPETPVWITGDATRLTQIFDNLLTNALKFTNPEGEVCVSVAVEATQARLSVRDNGIGIAPDILPGVFDVFAQADKTLDRSRGGLGLGLAIVKGLVELHGGTVHAHSEGLGRGTEITFYLAREQALPLLTQAAVTPRTPGARQRVLVIEDNHDSAETLGLLLKLSGYEVTLTHTGPDGVRAADEWRPDVVICDIGLPGMDGFAVARRLRQAPSTAGVRLIALTGYGQEEDILNARAAGFDDLLVKPADPERLCDALQSADAAQRAPP